MISAALVGRGAGAAGGAVALALVGLVALLATLVASAGPGAASAQASPCPRAGEPATELPARVLRRATICRINLLRRNRGRPPVSPQSQLQRVAQRHTRVMVQTSCLKHRCPGEAPLHRRVRRSGYLDGANRWEYGHNTGCAVNARVMVRKWRQSDFHRRNLLKPSFRDVGVGALPRAPQRVGRCSSRMGTFTSLLAWREP